MADGNMIFAQPVGPARLSDYCTAVTVSENITDYIIYSEALRESLGSNPSLSLNRVYQCHRRIINANNIARAGNIAARSPHHQIHHF
jgi:hypothetical protein